MLRFQSAVTSLVASVLVTPLLLPQGQLPMLQDALGSTERALEVLHGLEQRLQTEPAAALGLILAATEEPMGDESERDRRLEALRNEVGVLQMELDAARSPMLAADGAVQSALGTTETWGEPRPEIAPHVTTGMDDALRALLVRPSERESLPFLPSGAGRTPVQRTQHAPPAGGEVGYSADPLRHGITCYRAGRYDDALKLLAGLDDATALYWRARALERLERLDEAIRAMEDAIAKGGEGLEQRRAQNDLEFLRWKRDFVKQLPGGAAAGGKPR